MSSISSCWRRVSLSSASRTAGSESARSIRRRNFFRQNFPPDPPNCSQYCSFQGFLPEISAFQSTVRGRNPTFIHRKRSAANTPRGREWWTMGLPLMCMDSFVRFQRAWQERRDCGDVPSAEPQSLRARGAPIPRLRGPSALLGRDASELRHETRPPRNPQSRTRTHRPLGMPLAAIPELAVNASAGAGAVNERPPDENARWYLSEAVVRNQAGAEPEHLRILKVQGNSMAPRCRKGIGCSWTPPIGGPRRASLSRCGMGTGSWSRLSRALAGRGSAEDSTFSGNPAYKPCTCLADEVHIVREVLGTLRRT